MHLLQSGVDISVIALWLGHESPKTTYMYVEADLVMKERGTGQTSGIWYDGTPVSRSSFPAPVLEIAIIMQSSRER